MDAGDFTFNMMFDNPKTSQVFVSGFLSDRDKGVLNNDDTMWNPSRKTREINIQGHLRARRSRRAQRNLCVERRPRQRKRQSDLSDFQNQRYLLMEMFDIEYSIHVL